MAKRRRVYKVRFKVNGKAKTYYTTAKSPDEAANKLRQKGKVIRSVKAA